MSDGNNSSEDDIAPGDGSPEFFERTPSSSDDSTEIDERINEFLDGQEEEGYLDAETHHFPGRFTFEDPELDVPPTPLPGDLISSAMVGDPVLDVTTDKNLVVDPFLDDKSKWFWANYTLIRPVIYTRYQYRTKTELIGYRFSDRRPDAYACAVVGRWLDVFRRPWLKVRVKFIDGGFCYQWEPLHVTLNSVIVPEAVFFIFQRGLIYQHKAWWDIKLHACKVTVSRGADERQNHQFLNAFAQTATNNEVV